MWSILGLSKKLFAPFCFVMGQINDAPGITKEGIFFGKYIQSLEVPTIH
jgi:hypothetical protein